MVKKKPAGKASFKEKTGSRSQKGRTPKAEKQKLILVPYKTTAALRN